MNHFKTSMLAAAALGLSLTGMQSTAAQGCATCGGYFYTAVSYSNTYGVPDYTYATRGPYSTSEECWQAVNDDYANSDGWLPFEGSPKCTYRFETDYQAYEDIIKDWNTGMNDSGTGNGTVIADKEVIAKIMDLRKTYNIEGYEAELNRLIAPITDPNNDPDETNVERK